MAQAPQGFTYQGVATDNNGFELQNQNIAVKASLLSSSATGAVVWQETHNTATDTFGLFNVVIGEGISTNSGSSATFSEVDWGAASHFMKVEIDVNGGTNYVHVGTSQMMSVPYALYAENVHNLNMDSILGAVYDSINASFASGAMSVSTFGDTLTLNGQSIIVPGLSYQNVVPIFGSVTDIDGNTYQTVTIGNIEIMTEDLETHTFSNGNSIPLWTGPINTPTYYVETNGDVLYSGQAVIDPQNVCPTGWHVATETEFNSIFSLFSDSTNTSTDCNGQPCLEYFWNSAVEVKSLDWKQITGCGSSYNHIPDGNNNSYLNLTRPNYITSDYSTVYYNNPSLRQFNLSCANDRITSSYPNIDNMSLRVRCVKD